MTVSLNIKRRINSYVELARALRGSKQTGQCFHVTFLCKKRKVLAIGINSYIKLCPSHKFGVYKPNKVDRTDRYIPGLHSEVSAIIKSGYTDCKDLTFFNIRINNNDQVASSKPCPNCYRVLKQVGFKAIYYFDAKGCVNVLKNTD
jgi:deoxycytidylate deaminase